MNRKLLLTGATGDTDRAAVKESINRGLDVRAMVHRKDERSAAVEKVSAEVVVGDLHKIYRRHGKVATSFVREN
jgi:NAD(P)H dehydrogenase (quinone)